MSSGDDWLGFFSESEYSRAVRRVGQADSLTLYCGAGVSQSITGLSWSGLMQALLDPLRESLIKYGLLKDFEFDELSEFVARQSQFPQRCASVVSRIIELHGDHPTSSGYDDSLRIALRGALYGSNGGAFSEGKPPLMESICGLVYEAISHGVSVSIVTTNYDSYLENAIRDNFALQHKLLCGGGAKLIPLWVWSNLTPPPDGPLPDGVNLFYIHGRMAKPGTPKIQPDGEAIDDGKIVLSEYDYFETQGATLETLERVGTSANCVVVAGSSLDDPPLVSWFQRARRLSDSGAKPEVVVLHSVDPQPMDSPTTPLDRRTVHSRFTRERLSHMGIEDSLQFGCFGAIPDFLWDCSIELVRVRESVALASTRTGRQQRYCEQALDGWMARAAPILKRQARLMKMHRTLKADAESIESSVRSMVPSDLDYDFKVELWLRGVAPHEGDANYLVKLVDSTGISLDPKMRRNDFYQHRFPVRSSGLRVLQLGQAELASLRKLGLDNNASRWQGFYSVPVQKSFMVDGIPGTVQCYVGSMTIAFWLKPDSLATPKERDDFCAWFDRRQRPADFGLAESRLRTTLQLKAADILSGVGL